MRLRLHPRFGLPGLAAVAALLLALPLAAVVTPHWQAQAQAQALRAQRLPPPVPVAVVPAASLPAVGEANARVAALLDLAARLDVVVARTQQRLEPPGPVQRLQLSMSTAAGYASLRAFVAEALRSDDGLALDRLRLRRPDAKSPTLEAELHWSLLLPPAAAPRSDAPRSDAPRSSAP